MSEEMLVRHCSPTLAGLKAGNLFSLRGESDQELCASTEDLNRRFSSKGLRFLTARRSADFVLVYVYRPKMLQAYFQLPEVKSLLVKFGYPWEMPEECVAKLIRKLRSGVDLPHEIGLFLGYPAEDVRGFIENKAACWKCAGCWKVYGDVAAARVLFAKYRKCTEVYCRLYEQGFRLEKLTVAA